MKKLWLFTFLYKKIFIFVWIWFFVFGWLIFKDEKKIQSEIGTQRQGYFKDNFNKPQILPKGSVSMATPTPRTLPLLHK